MVTREQVDQEIEKTLDAFKDRLEKNVKNGKDFWSDDTCDKEGLQSRCEGLSVFLLQGLDAPEKAQKYLPAEKIKEEINTIHKIVMDAGFIPTPYDFYEDLVKDQIEPPEFIDTVIFVLWCSIIGRNVLLGTKELDEETKQRIDQLIDKSIEWLIDTHISKQGWSGFCNKTSPFIYSTWTVANCVDAFKILKETATGNTKKLMEKLKGKLDEVRKWLFRFAGEQGDGDDEWKSDPARIDGKKIGYCVYGLDMLINLGAHESQPQLVMDLMTTLDKAWNNSEARFFKGDVHLLRARNEGEEGEAADIQYEDDSGLLMGLMALSKASRVLKDELSRTDSYNKITKTLEEMFKKMKDPEDGFYAKGLWADCEKRFSIYMTQRAIEALIEYRRFLPPGPVNMNQINAKIDELLEIVRKMDINVGKLLDEKVVADDIGRTLKHFQNELPKKKKE